ncbi:hypothetical protein [Microbacterium rhizophilus]|uniref:hypothetical protein n=1 Tax=Microbacterium rhizophilus TaxID=3138934 RepID=UPI0031EC19C6
MDELTFVRDLGAEVRRPTAAELTAARARLMVEIQREESAATPPVPIASRTARGTGGGDTGGVAPVTPLEPRGARGRRVGAIALAAAATVAVAAAAIGGVTLLRELAPDDRSAGPAPTPPPAGSEAPYVRLERTIEAATPWDLDTGAMAQSWADAESAIVTSATVSVYVPADPRAGGEWTWVFADDCELVGVYGAPADPDPALEICRQRDLEEPGVTRSTTWGRIASGAGGEDDDGTVHATPLLDGGYGIWDELPRDPAALLAWYRSRADTFERSWLGAMTEAVALNQMPDDLHAAMLESLALVPDARVGRFDDGSVQRIDVAEPLGGDASQSTTLRVDGDTRLASLTESRRFGGDPGAFTAQVPSLTEWTTRTIISAVPTDDAPGPGVEAPEGDGAPPAPPVLTPDGLGGVVVGESLSESARADLTWDESCAEGYWRPGTEDGRPGEAGDLPPQFQAATDGTPGGPIQIIEITDGRLRTSGGIGIGSTIDELLAAHPDAAEVVAEDDGTGAQLGYVRYELAGDRGRLGFLIPTDETWSAQVGQIVSVAIMPYGGPYNGPAWGESITGCVSG